MAQITFKYLNLNRFFFNGEGEGKIQEQFKSVKKRHYMRCAVILSSYTQSTSIQIEIKMLQWCN